LLPLLSFSVKMTVCPGLGKIVESFDVNVTNSVIGSNGCNALQFGSETLGNFHDYLFENITVTAAGKAGIGIVTMDGAHISNIKYKNITMQNTTSALYFYIGGRLRRPPAGLPTNDSLVGGIYNITVVDVHATRVFRGGRGNSSRNWTATLEGQPADASAGLYETHYLGPNIVFNNFTVESAGGADAAAAAAIPPHVSGSYPPRYLQTRPSYGMFLRRAKGITLSEVGVSWLDPDGRPPFILNDVHAVSFLDGVRAEGASPPSGYDIGLRDGCTELVLSGSSASLVVKNIAAVAALGTAAAAAEGCASPSDCSYNGHCAGTQPAGAGLLVPCVCDAGWLGPKCSTLNLLPAMPGAGLNTTDFVGPVSSWGGTVNEGDDGQWHMHVAQFVQNCGFNGWATNSRVVHAVASVPDGRFQVKGVVFPVWAHNPAVVRAPTGEWVMTFVSNTSANVGSFEATCNAQGVVTKNSSIASALPENQHNFMSISKSPAGPWSAPVPIDKPFDDAVPPFLIEQKWPNRNTNIIISIQPDGSMVGLWRRCCSPPEQYQPPGGGGASVVFSVHATHWRNVSTWKASSRALFPELNANGYEDPHLWRDPHRKGEHGEHVFHAGKDHQSPCIYVLCALSFIICGTHEAFRMVGWLTDCR
jgi:hypothetical protein